MSETETDVRLIVCSGQAEKFNALGFDRVVVYTRANVGSQRRPLALGNANECAIIAWRRRSLESIGGVIKGESVRCIDIAICIAKDIRSVEHVNNWQPGSPLIYGIFDRADAVLVLFPKAMIRQVHVSLAGEVKVGRKEGQDLALPIAVA